MKGNKIKLIQYLLEQPDDKIFELKEHKEKRNLNQNGMYWKLLNELSLKLKIGIEELHKQMLRDYSVRYEILVPKEYKLRGIEYYDAKSMIKKDDKEFIVYYVYTPSHELKENEFAVLLNGLVEECRNAGVDIIEL